MGVQGELTEGDEDIITLLSFLFKTPCSTFLLAGTILHNCHFTYLRTLHASVITATYEAASSEGEEEAPTTADYAGWRGATATGTITAASYARLNRALSSSPPPCSSSTAGSSLRRATIEDDGHCCYVARKRKTPSLGMRKEKSCPPLPVALYRRNHTHAVRCSLLFNDLGGGPKCK
nr:hypothetical protein Itr_chr07CG10090 [Ipomoea trifida]